MLPSILPTPPTLQDSWSSFSRSLSAAETQYLDLGMSYHSIPLPIRETHHTAEIRDALDAAFTTATPTNLYAPRRFRLILYLTELRDYRDAAKRCIRSGRLEEAEYGLAAGRALLSSVEGQLRELEQWVEGMEPWTRVSRDEVVRVQEQASRFLWLSALPEVRRSVKLGSEESERAAVERLLEEYDEEERKESSEYD